MDATLAVTPQYVANPARPIAFYLPQFHPVPENDRWWGKGFTEWTNVAKALPNFAGHVQPRQPADLGYYDLRLPEIQEQQAELAAANGIHGFCYYYYWFSGRRLLERPLYQMLERKSPKFPFCICWANENWTRAWDGSKNQVLISQKHSYENCISFLNDILPVFEDDRYIKIDDEPVLLIYRPSIISNIEKVIEAWRTQARTHGFPDLHLVAVESFGYSNTVKDGFDASVEFPPHSISVSDITHQIRDIHPEFHGRIYNYHEMVSAATEREVPEHTLYRGIMVSWDNTARRGRDANIYYGSTPHVYERWLRFAVDQTRQNRDLKDPFLFINAWNEWAEGAYLEPDTHFGKGYLQATRNALQPVDAADFLLDALKTKSLRQDQRAAVIDELKDIFQVQSVVMDTLLRDIHERLSVGGAGTSKGQVRHERAAIVAGISDRLSQWPKIHSRVRAMYRLLG